MRFLTKYDLTKEKEGTVFKLPSLTNQDSEKDVNIKTMIERYGVKGLQTLTKAENEMYIDTTFFEDMNLNDIIKMKHKMKEDFLQLPAKVRKEFGDDFDEFYEKFRKGKFDQFIENGVLSEESVNEIRTIQEQQKNKYIEELTNTYKLQELAKQQALQEIQTTKEVTNEN